MSVQLARRALLRRAVQAAGLSLPVPLFAACAPASTPSPTAAPATPAGKPTEAPAPASKPAAPAASPAAAAPAAAPAASPAAAAPAAPAASPAAAAGTAAKPTAPAVAGPVAKIGYAFASVNPYHIVAVVGSEKPELVRKHGIEFDMVTTQNSPNAVNAVVGGSLTVGAVTPDAAWAAQDRATDLMQVMGAADGTPYALIVNPDIKKPADLKGKTIGASALRGGADTTAVKILLNENGVKEGEYSLVQVGSVAERTAAMKAGQIHGCVQLEPQATLLRDGGFPEIDNADNYTPLKTVQTLIIFTKKSWYEGKPQEAAGFVKAWLDVTNWLYAPNNKEELIEIMMRTMKVERPAAMNAYDRHIVKSQTPTKDAKLVLEKAQQFAQNLRSLGGEGVPTDVAKYLDLTFVDRMMQA